MLDLDNFKINCSQIGSLLGNSKWNKRPSETDIKKLYNFLGRDYGELTPAMKFSAREILTKAIEYDPKLPSDKILSEIVLIYAYEMYGKGKVSKGNESPHETEKGNMAEPEAIKALSVFDGENYNKNEELFSNKWFKGVPDIICRDESEKIVKIIEVKSSYDLPSFIMSMIKNEKPSNVYEVMGYMDILKCKNAEIVHVLVDMPDKIASFEEKRLRERYDSLEIEESEIDKRIGRVLSNMEYSGISDQLKIFRRPVSLNPLTIKVAKSRAVASRKWIREIHEGFTRNIVNLSSTDDHQEDSI